MTIRLHSFWLVVLFSLSCSFSQAESKPAKVISWKPLGIPVDADLDCRFVGDDRLLLSWSPHNSHRHGNDWGAGPENLLIVTTDGAVVASSHMEDVEGTAVQIGDSSTFIVVQRRHEMVVLDGLLHKVAEREFDAAEQFAFLGGGSRQALVGLVERLGSGKRQTLQRPAERGRSERHYFLFPGGQPEPVSEISDVRSGGISDYGWILCGNPDCSTFKIAGVEWEVKGFSAKELTFVSPGRAVWLGYDDHALHEIQSEGRKRVIADLSGLLPGGVDWDSLKLAAHQTSNVFLTVVGCHIGGREICLGTYGRLLVVDADTGRLVFSAKSEMKDGVSTSISPDGKLISLAQKGRIALYHVA